MDMSQYSGGGYLKAADVANGPLRQVIRYVAIKNSFGSDKPELEFDDGSKLSLNATNNRALIAAYGANSDDWLNKEIELSATQVVYQGQMKDSIAVKAISPSTQRTPISPAERQAMASKQSLRNEMDDEIPFVWLMMVGGAATSFAFSVLSQLQI
jgi:hypothetical protein